MVLNKKIFYILALESRPHLGKSSKGRPRLDGAMTYKSGGGQNLDGKSRIPDSEVRIRRGLCPAAD